MKKIFIISFIIFITILSAEIIDEIVAKVGRDIILKSDLEKRKSQLEAAGMLTADITNFDILNDLVESKLILQKAKDDDYEMDEFEAKRIAEQQIQSIAAQFKTEMEFRSELQKETGLSILELKEFYTQQIIEQRMKDEIIKNEIKNKIQVTEAEVEEYYFENKAEIPDRPEMDQLGMIMKIIKPSEETNKKALISINKIKDRLNEGEDFSELAKAESEGPSSVNGGDLGFFGKGTMVKPFEDAAFSLIPGEVSEVVQTDFGYHLIKLEEKQGDDIRVRHILKKVEPTTEDIDETIILMNDILDKLNDNEDFYILAETYSDDDSTAANGGIIGEFTALDYPELFKEKLQNLDYGEYTSLIREGDVLYIFGKLIKIDERAFTYNEIYDKLHEIVISEKEIELYEEWMKELINEKYVEILLE